MTLITSLRELPIIYRLGWGLLHSVWEGLLIGLLLAIVLMILRSQSARARYLASGISLLAMLLLPAATAMLFNAPPQPARAIFASDATTTSSHGPSAAAPADRSPLLHVSAHHPSPLQQQERLVEQSNASAPQMAAPPEPLPSRKVTTFGRALADLLPRVVTWLVPFWLIGVLALSVWNVGAWLWVQRLKSRSTHAVGGAVEAMAAKLAQRLQLRQRVRLLQSTMVDSPLVIGLIKPLILLPASVLTDLPPAQLEALLAHELAHVLRHDYLVNLLQTVAETLLFYHPAAWWVSARLRDEREQCCDDLAIAVTRDRATYARALASVAGAAVPRLAPAAARGELLHRVRRILGQSDADAGCGSRWLAGAIVLAITIGCTLLLTGKKVIAQDAAKSPPATQPSKTQEHVLSITVIDQQTGNPIEGANLRPLINGNSTASLTDAQGKGQIKLPSEGVIYLNLLIKKDHYVPTMVVWRKENLVPPQYTVPIEPGTMIGGKVVDEAGKPIAGVSVGLWVRQAGESPQGKPFMQIHDISVVTNAEGKWSADFIPKVAQSINLRLSHPDYVSDDLYGRSSNPSIEELRKTSAISVMKKGLKVAGRVLDADGKPLSGAEVSLGPRNYGHHSPTTQAAADGSFAFAHCAQGLHAPLIATAKDHAPQMIDVAVDHDLADLELRLPLPKPMTVRIVNPRNEPLANTRLFLQRWRGVEGINWDVHTDADGKVTWVEAPLEGATFCISQPGYIQFVDKPLHGGPDLQTVTLLPDLKVSGTVVDDATGQPVAHFTVVRGWASQGNGIFWERGTSEDAKPGHDGKFELVENVDRDGYAVRIEADGYMPVDSKVFHMADGDVSLDFRLKKAADLAGTLLRPDGSALAGADVLLVTTTSQIGLKSGRPDQSTFAPRTTSDSSGHFHFPPQSGKYLVMVAHEQGFALLRPEQLAGSSPIVVQPWGRVEGNAFVGAKAAAGRTITALSHIQKQDGNADRADADFMRTRMQDDAQTDADGHFTLAHVPPGRSTVGIEVRYGETPERMSMISWTQREKVDAVAGKTVTITLGGKGRPVVGRVQVPPALVGKVDWYRGSFAIRSRLHLPGRVLPPDWNTMDAAARAKWNQEWRKRPDVQQYNKELASEKDYPVVVRPDGAFRVDDVVAGTYTINIRVEPPPGPDGRLSSEAMAFASQEFTVPPMPGGRSDEPLNLGTIGLATNTSVKVGDDAPGFSAKTVDGKPIALGDFRGKFVLVDFWATWCGPCVAEMPNLKAVHDAFGNDPRFAMVSLSVDEKPDAPRQFAMNQGLNWPQVFLGDWSLTNVPNAWAVHGIPAVFLISPDGKILADNLRGGGVGERLVEAPAAK
jgi:beta-lactamase regulating signal transducer with metallopeptidase domain/thiol-disulfide isomerase/thioredoxin